MLQEEADLKQEMATLESMTDRIIEAFPNVPNVAQVAVGKGVTSDDDSSVRVDRNATLAAGGAPESGSDDDVDDILKTLGVFINWARERKKTFKARVENGSPSDIAAVGRNYEGEDVDYD